jgi:sugar lactone lactonase YvrE
VTKSRRRKIIIIALLLLVLLLLGLWYLYFRSTRQLGFDFEAPDPDTIVPPTYLYSFSGDETDQVQRPIGIFVSGDDVYVSDSRKAKIYRFDQDGELIDTFGEGEVLIPLYIAQNPLDDNLYISDRRLRKVHIFSPEGELLGEFDPNLPPEQLPPFETGGFQWAPVALAFGEDGTLYATEILNGHRLLIFDPEGDFVRSVGTVGQITEASEFPEIFQFPNNVKVQGEEVWVADSNNRRLQVFDLEGEFDRIVVTEGLPRGLDFLNPFSDDEPVSEEDTSTPSRFVVIDTLSHDGTIWNTEGDKIVNFGERGVLEGQFNYPNDTSVAEQNLIFVADSANGRIQVWGWPEEVVPVPLPTTPQQWGWCLTPLLLLPLLWLLRKKRFFATEDFVEGMLVAELVDQMPQRRRKWLVTEPVYERFKDEVQGEITLAELLNGEEYSESDVNALMEKLEVDRETAIILALAQRAHVFCTDDEEYRRYAKVLEIDVVNRQEYLERFGKKDEEGRPPTLPGGGPAGTGPTVEGGPPTPAPGAEPPLVEGGPAAPEGPAEGAGETVPKPKEE